MRATHGHPSIDLWPEADLALWQTEPTFAFNEWLASYYVVGTRQFRESSRDTYTAIFSCWLRFVVALGKPITHADSGDAAQFFEEQQLAPISRRRYLQLLDKVYDHLASLGWEGANPVQPELARELVLDIAPPLALSAAELRDLVACLADLPGWRGARDRGLAALMAGAGLRTNEVVDLRLGAVSPTFHINVVPAGVHRSHATCVLPCAPWQTWLPAWLTHRKLLGLPGELVCPATKTGKVYSPSGLFRRIGHWFEWAGIQQSQRGGNVLRNTFAQTALTCGSYSVPQVREFLGHEDDRATLRHLPASSAHRTHGPSR